MQLTPIREDVEPIVVPSCPPLLSVGDRCMNHGWRFNWPPYQAPYYIKPDGTKVLHIVKNNCPYIIDETMKAYQEDFPEAFPTITAPIRQLAGGIPPPSGQSPVIDPAQPVENKRVVSEVKPVEQLELLPTRKAKGRCQKFVTYAHARP